MPQQINMKNMIAVLEDEKKTTNGQYWAESDGVAKIDLLRYEGILDKILNKLKSQVIAFEDLNDMPLDMEAVSVLIKDIVNETTDRVNTDAAEKIIERIAMYAEGMANIVKMSAPQAQQTQPRAQNSLKDVANRMAADFGAKEGEVDINIAIKFLTDARTAIAGQPELYSILREVLISLAIDKENGKKNVDVSSYMDAYLAKMPENDEVSGKAKKIVGDLNKLDNLKKIVLSEEQKLVEQNKKTFKDRLSNKQKFNPMAILGGIFVVNTEKMHILAKAKEVLDNYKYSGSDINMAAVIKQAIGEISNKPRQFASKPFVSACDSLNEWAKEEPIMKEGLEAEVKPSESISPEQTAENRPGLRPV